MKLGEEQIKDYHEYEEQHFKTRDFIQIPAQGCAALREDNPIFKGKKAVASRSCSGLNLSFIFLPENIEYIGQSGFSSNENLLEFTAQEGLQVIGRYAFADCYQLRSVELPNSLKVVGKHAFKRCYQLQEVVIPPQVEQLPPVEDSPFVSCSKLEKIVCNECLKDLIVEYSAYLPSIRKIILTDKEGNKVMTLKCAENNRFASDGLGIKKHFREIRESDKSKKQKLDDAENLTI